MTILYNKDKFITEFCRFSIKPSDNIAIAYSNIMDTYSRGNIGYKIIDMIAKSMIEQIDTCYLSAIGITNIQESHHICVESWSKLEENINTMVYGNKSKHIDEILSYKGEFIKYSLDILSVMMNQQDYDRVKSGMENVMETNANLISEVKDKGILQLLAEFCLSNMDD